MKNTSISACLLVNDETTLAKCLESIKNVVDEIIIVDTSLHLINKKVALRFTDKYFGFKWNDNFSYARNFSIGKATGDWILIIDPDEYLVRAESIRKNLLADVDVSYLMRYNLNNKGKILSREKIVRIFKNNKGFKFSRSIHEFLVDKDIAHIKHRKLLKGPIIYHTGYSSDKIMEKKFSRNFKLLEEEIKVTPNRKVVYFYLARNYFNQARFLILKKGKVTNTAVELLEKSMEMSVGYMSSSGDDKLKADAKKLQDLCSAILSFQNHNEFKKLIAIND